MLAVVGLFASYFVQHSIAAAERQLQQRGRNMARQLAEAVSFDLFSGNLPYVKRLLDFELDARQAGAVGSAEEGRWTLVSGAASRLPRLADLPANAAGDGQSLYFVHAVGLPGSTEEDPYLELDRRGGRHIVVIVVLGREPVTATRAQVLQAMLGMAGLSLLLALVLAWRLSRRLSRPLHGITRAVAQLADGSLAVRVAEVSSGELGQLERGVNRMAAALEHSQHDLELRVQGATAALLAQKEAAEAAVQAKSRFLAAASHDLRQPLQTLALLQGLLARAVEGERERKLVARIGETLGAMTGMLNALLDINQIEAGVVRAEIVLFPVNDLLVKLRDELAYQAEAKSLALRMVPCSLSIYSDPHILEQMIRNLLANALKYTKSGKILLGCRRRDGRLRIEVWDTGIGIPDAEIQAIFDEYHQVGNEARERSLGLGLGLSIVRRLGNLLGHRVHVRSRHGDGSVFSIEVALPDNAMAVKPADRRNPDESANARPALRKGAILVVEDDPQLRELLAQFLNEEGHRVARAYDGVEAMQLVEREDFRPDAILADFNLPNGMNGLEVTAKVREKLHREIPIIILTGDISTKTLRAIAGADCAQLNKPVKLEEVTQAIQQALAPKTQRPRAHPQADTVPPPGPPVIYVVDDDNHIRAALRSVLEDDGRTVEDFVSCEDFLEAFRPGREACLLIDAHLPGMGGLELLQRLSDEGRLLPAVMITGNADVAMAVQAMKAGASDFIEKPIGRDELLACVERALDHSQDSTKLIAWREAAANHMAGLTPRQKQVMELVLAGCPSKNIAADLGISQRTVENHRAEIMKRTGAKSLPALARLAVAAAH